MHEMFILASSRRSIFEMFSNAQYFRNDVARRIARIHDELPVVINHFRNILSSCVRTSSCVELQHLLACMDTFDLWNFASGDRKESTDIFSMFFCTWLLLHKWIHLLTLSLPTKSLGIHSLVPVSYAIDCVERHVLSCVMLKR